MNGLKDEPIMGSGAELGGSDSQAQFKGHIESRCRGRSAIQLDPGEIVNRIAATADQIDNFVQPVLAA